jgi:nicotinamidase/pyrazinamidase
MSKKALIVVDPQNDFCPGGALAVPNGDEIIDVANREINSGMYDIIVLTADWHPANHRSFASNNPGVNPGEVGLLDGRQQVFWPDHCVQGTHGSSFHINLNTTPANLIIRKGMNKDVDSYSAFYDHAGFATGLDMYLVSNHITDAYILGLATEYCVKWTALDCQKSVPNVYTHLILDGCRGININEGDVDLAIEEMDKAFIEIIK